MRVINHQGFGHGLPPGTDRDINCKACRREQAEGQEPVVTGSDDVQRTAPKHADPEAWVWK